jgi:hypothetical protein
VRKLSSAANLMRLAYVLDSDDLRVLLIQHLAR